MPVDLFTRKRTHFLLWRPAITDPPPMLLIGEPAQPIKDFRQIALVPDAAHPEIWAVSADACGLTEDTVYYYWFQVTDANPQAPQNQTRYCTDPMATAVDRGFPAPAAPGGTASGDPASIVAFIGGVLVACDNGETEEPLLPDWTGDPDPADLPVNDALIIYELPTRWARIDTTGQTQVGDGTFRDALALLLVDQDSPTFPSVRALKNRAHLIELGVTCLELLPCADHDDPLDWGYGTANYFAADYALGLPSGQTRSTATTDLVSLIRTCHENGLRFFIDAVMAWCRRNPYVNVNFLDFFLKDSSDPEFDSRHDWGGQIFKYNYWIQGYDPISGTNERLVSARQLMAAYIAYWMEFYRIDGVRLDDVPDIYFWDFVGQVTAQGRAAWQARGGSDDRFLTVGEYLSVPAETALISQGRLDSLWNDTFREIARSVLLGRNWAQDASFESSVHKLIDPRWQGFTDPSQIVNYLGSHDVEGDGRQRLYNWFLDNGVAAAEPRLKLGFSCLLTAVGLPMILAGDEFADQMDPPDPSLPFWKAKQHDPVNWSRAWDDWRQRVFSCVSSLVKLRARSVSLQGDSIKFLHADFDDGKRVLAWQRGPDPDPVVVVANFSDWGSPDPMNPASEYRVSNWPATPAGRGWHEVTQDRVVPGAWAGREPLYPWEAKVYELVHQEGG